MSDNFEEYNVYKIKHSLVITESTIELMNMMTHIIDTEENRKKFFFCYVKKLQKVIDN